MRWALPFAAAVVGCGPASSSDGTLTVSPDLLDFGEVVVGLVGRATLVFENDSRGVIRILEARPNDALRADVRLDRVPAALSAVDRVEVDAVFAPSTPGIRAGIIAIHAEGKASDRAAPFTRMLEVVVIGIAVEPSLVATPADIDFGRVVIGQTATVAVTLENRGTSEVTIASVTPDRDTDEFSVDPSPIATVAPGRSASFVVRFAPLFPGVARGRIVVSDDSQRPRPLGIDVVGEGTEGELEIEPRELTFVGVFLGETRTRSFSVKNTGTSTHTLESIALLQARDAFSSSTAVSFPFPLSPGGQVRVFVSFHAATPSSESGLVQIASTARSGTADVSLFGTTVSPPKPRLRVSPAEVDFGGVELGHLSGRLITLTSTGTDALHVTSVTIDPPGAPYEILGPVVPSLSEVDDHHILEIAFLPTSTGPVPASLVIVSDDPEDPIKEVLLKGRGESTPSADVDVRPIELLVGRVPRGTVSIRAVEVANRGTSDLALVDARVAEDAGGRFSLLSSNQAVLGPGESRDLLVELADVIGANGRHSGRLELVFDDLDRPRVDVALEAETISQRDPTFEDAVIRLDWSAGGANLDLHLVRPGGSTFDAPSDCCFCNPNPPWLGGPDARPFLDTDDRDGGPETIHLPKAPTSGTYSIEAHHRGAPAEGVAVASVEVMIRGAISGPWARAIGPGQRWRVGHLLSDGTNISFVFEQDAPLDSPPIARCF